MEPLIKLEIDIPLSNELMEHLARCASDPEWMEAHRRMGFLTAPAEDYEVIINKREVDS